MGVFDKFNKEIDMKKIERQMKEAASNGDYEPVPAGKYIAKVENMDIVPVKSDGRPMFKVQMRLVEGCGEKEEAFLSKYKKKKPCIFMNRVMCGTKNDGNMIRSVVSFLNNLDLYDEEVVFAYDYDAFKKDVMDIAEDAEDVEYEIEYDDSAFNSISINGVYKA